MAKLVEKGFCDQQLKAGNASHKLYSDSTTANEEDRLHNSADDERLIEEIAAIEV